MSTKRAAVAAAGLCSCLAGAPADGHHAIGSVVDTSRTMQSAMVLTKVDWINPHAWFHFSMTRPDGAVVKDVAVEWMGLAGLRQAGYASADAFPVGRSYTVTYYPNRDGSPGGHLVSMLNEAGVGIRGRGAAAPAPQPQPPPPVPAQRPRYLLGNDDQ